MKGLVFFLVAAGATVVVKTWDCPNYKVVDPFALSDFNGIWYQYAQYSTLAKLGYLTGIYGRCVISKYKYNASECLTHIYTEQYNKYLTTKSYTNDGTGRYVDKYHPDGRIYVTETIYGKKLQVIMRIIAFEKEEFAVVHLCKSIWFFFRFEAVWALTRYKIPSNKTKNRISEVLEHLKSQGGPDPKKDYVYENWETCPTEQEDDYDV